MYFLTSWFQERDALLAAGLDRRAAIARVIGRAALPGLVNSVTSAAGFLAFASAKMAVIRQLGVFAGLGIALAYVSSLFVVTVGFRSQTGYPDGPPTEIGESTGYRSANCLAIAILAGLEHRDRTGEGQYIDLSSREVVAMLAPEGLLARLSGEAPPLRIGNRDAVIAPHNVYRCAGDDQWIAIAATDDAMWKELCGAIGDATLAAAYPHVVDRLTNVSAIDARIEAFTASHAVGEVFARLQTAGVAASPSFTNEALARDPHVVARHIFTTVDPPVMGRTTVMRAPRQMSGAPCAVERHGTLMNQDGEAVLSSLLGMTAEEIGTYTEVLR